MEQHRIAGATRRTVLAGMAAALVPGSPVAQAQHEPQGSRRLGVLLFIKNDPEGQPLATAFTQGLAALGWHEGSNLRIDWRWASGDPALFERYAAELVALGPEVLLAPSNLGVEALRRKTRTIPIVFLNISDPVGQGLVESEAHPGGTITGFSDFDPPMATKWLQMLTQISPPVTRVAVLYHPVTAAYAGVFLRSIEDAAQTLKVTVRSAPVKDDAEIEALMAGLAREDHGGLLVLPDVFNVAHRKAIVSLATTHRLAAVYPYRYFTDAGGLMSYGVDVFDLFRRSAAYVDRILKGEKPGDLPVQNPVKFELVINLKTAKALGVTIAPSMLNNADEVIE